MHRGGMVWCVAQGQWWWCGIWCGHVIHIDDVVCSVHVLLGIEMCVWYVPCEVVNGYVRL